MPSLRNAAGDLAAVLTVPTPRPGDFPGGQQEAEQEAEKELEAGMNNDHWPVYDQATAEPKSGYNPSAWSAEAADDWPVPYTLTPAAEALLESEAGA
jgi:hypothetical protein